MVAHLRLGGGHLREESLERYKVVGLHRKLHKRAYGCRVEPYQVRVVLYRDTVVVSGAKIGPHLRLQKRSRRIVGVGVGGTVDVAIYGQKRSYSTHVGQGSAQDGEG